MIFGSKETFAIEYELRITGASRNAACVLWVRSQPVGNWENIGADSTIGDTLGAFSHYPPWNGDPPWPEEPAFAHKNDRQILELVMAACWSVGGTLYPSIAGEVDRLVKECDERGHDGTSEIAARFSVYCLMPGMTEPFDSHKMAVIPLGTLEKVVWCNFWDPQLYAEIFPAGTVIGVIREFMNWWHAQHERKHEAISEKSLPP
jgi:hypothetical protein